MRINTSAGQPQGTASRSSAWMEGAPPLLSYLVEEQLEPGSNAGSSLIAPRMRGRVKAERQSGANDPSTANCPALSCGPPPSRVPSSGRLRHGLGDERFRWSRCFLPRAPESLSRAKLLRWLRCGHGWAASAPRHLTTHLPAPIIEGVHAHPGAAATSFRGEAYQLTRRFLAPCRCLWKRQMATRL